MIDRRRFVALSTATLAATRLTRAQKTTDAYTLVAKQDRARIRQQAEHWLPAKPDTIPDHPSPKSPGGPHDFFSEADYFWPNPKNPDGPYINRDGESNPDNFNDHRKAMIRLSLCVPALAAAYLLTRSKSYANAAAAHLRAWFITADTRMTPNLQYSQGYHGGPTGRSYGIIDTLHLVEVARAAQHLRPIFSATDYAALQQWFREYLDWMKTSKFGTTERDATNNHSICWSLQAAEFTNLTRDDATRKEVRDRFLNIQLPGQMAANGSFPAELRRTKPYSYSIFNFDCAASLCQSLDTTPGGLATDELLRYTVPSGPKAGAGMCKAAEFLFPYLAEKFTWPYPHDVQHWESWPVRSPGLLFCGLACKHEDYIALWRKLDPDPTDPEIIRNFPLRQPLLWV